MLEQFQFLCLLRLDGKVDFKLRTYHIFNFQATDWFRNFRICSGIANCRVAMLSLFDEDQRKRWKRNIKTRPPALY
jgi:hypothetical protein